MLAIVDANPLYAALDPRDRQHQRSRDVLERPDLQLVIPALAVAEASYLAQRWIGPHAEKLLFTGLADMDVVAPNPDDFLRISELVERYADRPGLPNTRPVIVWALALALAIGFAVEIALGGSMNPNVLRAIGLVPYNVVRKGEWWRLLTFSVVHAGPVHLGFNVVGLWALGPFVERTLGRLRFLAVYALSALAGGLVLVGMFLVPGHDSETLLVGASGGVMGIVGATAAILLRGWRVEKARVALDRLVMLLALVVAQALIDALVPMLSFTAHATGVLVGFAAAWATMPTSGRSPTGTGRGSRTPGS